MLTKLFLDHPRTLGESYLQHQRAAFSFAFSLLFAGLAALLHGLVPSIFETTASRAIARLHARVLARNPATLRHDRAGG